MGTRWRPGTSLLAILTSPATRTEDWKLLTCCSVAQWTCALLINLAYASSSEDVLSSSRCSRAARSTSAMHARARGGVLIWDLVAVSSVNKPGWSNEQGK